MFEVVEPNTACLLEPNIRRYSPNLLNYLTKENRILRDRKVLGLTSSAISLIEVSVESLYVQYDLFNDSPTAMHLLNERLMTQDTHTRPPHTRPPTHPSPHTPVLHTPVPPHTFVLIYSQHPSKLCVYCSFFHMSGY